MNRLITRTRLIVTIILLSILFIHPSLPALAASVIKLQNWQGSIDYVPNGLSTFALDGTASHLGQFSAYGEIQLLPAQGSFDGDGIVVFEAANGDLLVGVTTWQVGADTLGSLHFSWRDSVTFSDGTIVSSTGRFEHDRPSGLVVIAIIAILIGLLLPAVQK